MKPTIYPESVSYSPSTKTGQDHAHPPDSSATISTSLVFITQPKSLLSISDWILQAMNVLTATDGDIKRNLFWRKWLNQKGRVTLPDL
jgi:hypothetical protein